MLFLYYVGLWSPEKLYTNQVCCFDHYMAVILITSIFYSSLRAKRSNPEGRALSLGCFARNDGFG